MELPEGAVVYCDIPFDTPTLKNLYGGIGFDRARFCLWALDTALQGIPVYVSEYRLPDPLFRRVAMKKKTSLLSSNGAISGVEEGLWVIDI